MLDTPDDMSMLSLAEDGPATLRDLEVALVLKDGIGFKGIIEQEIRKFLFEPIDSNLLEKIGFHLEGVLRGKGVRANVAAVSSPQSPHGIDVTVSLCDRALVFSVR